MRKSQNKKYFNGKIEDLSSYIPEGADLHNKCELSFDQRMYLVLKGVALGDLPGSHTKPLLWTIVKIYLRT